MGREWHFDNRSLLLTYKPNTTTTGSGDHEEGAAAAPNGEFVATREKVLFNVTGTQAAPAHHIAITGLTLRDAAHTYFDSHGLPSGGDWALAKTGAISLVGTASINISGNLLTRLDGNAIFIGGYSRNCTVGSNEFECIGGSAIASWGDTGYKLTENATTGDANTLPWPVGPDGRGGNQPRGTRVVGNIVREIGIWQKQSSAYFQAVSALSVVQGNVFFNGARAVRASAAASAAAAAPAADDDDAAAVASAAATAADWLLAPQAINLNDGFGGGDDISRNLIFNQVRESKDHGPINSWDRVPYITTLRYNNGSASIIPADRHVHHNFIIATYNSEGALDTDDGSAYLRAYENFFAYGSNGLKGDFGGHDQRWHGNVIAYAGGCFGAPMPFRYFHGFNDAFVNNSCVAWGKGYGVGVYSSDCDLDRSWTLGANKVYTADGTCQICGKYSWEQWFGATPPPARKNAFDVGSTLAKWPADAELVGWAEALLGFSATL